MSIDRYESRESAERWYAESGYKEKDEAFRKSLELGPQVRRWLGWGGAKVQVLRAYQGFPAPLCPTDWVYEFVALHRLDFPVNTSSEINFCADEDVIDRCLPWYRTEQHIDFLRNDVQDPGPLMYHI